MNGEQSPVTTAEMARLIHVPVEDLSDEEVATIARICWEDPVYFCKYFLSHLFPKRIPWLHRGTWALLTKRVDFLDRYGETDKIFSNFVFTRDGKEESIFSRGADGKITLWREKFTLLLWPRGFSKTTLAGLAFNLYNILFEEQPFALYVSATANHAELQINNIKRELETNERIRAFFGVLKPGMQDPKPWRQDMFETTSGMAMVARGAGGQVRGLLHNGQRPKIVIVDDLEDRESVSTIEQRTKIRDWAYADLQPVLPMMDPDAAIVALGTLLHPQSLLMTWAQDPQWTTVKIGAYDKQGELVWPENLDAKKLEKEKKSAIVSNTLSSFYMERMSEIRAVDGRDFVDKYFNYNPPPGPYPFISLYQDPAISKQETADRCTFTVAAMTERGRIVVLEQKGERGMTPRKQIDTLFELKAKWAPTVVGIESNGFQQALVHLVQEEMFRKKMYFEVVPVTNARAKHARIKGILQPRFAAGYISFATQLPELVGELLDFPLGQHDDFADGLAGAVSLLDPAAFLAESDGEEAAKVVPLDEVIGGNWRRAV